MRAAKSALLVAVVILTATCISVLAEAPQPIQVIESSTSVLVEGWVLEIRASTASIWFLGDQKYVNISVVCIAKGSGSRIIIYRVEASVFNVSSSVFGGYLQNSGDSINASVQLTLPSYTLLQSDYAYTNIRVIIYGALEKDLNTTLFSIPLSLQITLARRFADVILYLSVNPRAPLTFEQSVITLRLLNPSPSDVIVNYLAILVDGEPLYVESMPRILSTGSTMSFDAPYIFTREGIHNVTAQLIGYTSSGERISVVKSISVAVKRRLAVAISVNSSTVQVGTGLSITCRTDPPLSGVPASVEYSVDGFSWSPLTIVTLSNGSLTYVWIPQQAGAYYVRCSTMPQDLYAESYSSTAYVRVYKAKPRITLILETPPPIYAGTQIRFSVSVDPPIDGAEVILEERVGESWRPLSRIVLSSALNRYSINVTLMDPGLRIVRARIPEADRNYEALSSEVQLMVSERAATTPITTGRAESAWITDIILYVVAAGSIAMAALLLMIGGRRRGGGIQTV